LNITGRGATRWAVSCALGCVLFVDDFSARTLLFRKRFWFIYLTDRRRRTCFFTSLSLQYIMSPFPFCSRIFILFCCCCCATQPLNTILHVANRFSGQGTSQENVQVYYNKYIEVYAMSTVVSIRARFIFYLHRILRRVEIRMYIYIFRSIYEAFSFSKYYPPRWDTTRFTAAQCRNLAMISI